MHSKGAQLQATGVREHGRAVGDESTPEAYDLNEQVLVGAYPAFCVST